MTPDYARNVYVASLYQAYRDNTFEWSNPVIQFQCEMKAWRAVVENPETPETVSALKAYEDAKANMKTHPDAVQRAWEEYTMACEKAANEA